MAYKTYLEFFRTDGEGVIFLESWASEYDIFDNRIVQNITTERLQNNQALLYMDLMSTVFELNDDEANLLLSERL